VGSRLGAISSDGRYVAFLSGADNLLAGQNHSSFYFDVFVWDRVTDTTVLASPAPGSTVNGSNSASSVVGMTDDGRFVAFRSASRTLIAGGTDTNGQGNDLFLWDRTTGNVTLVSHTAGSTTTTANGEVSAGSLSGDGRWLAFSSSAPDMIPGGTDTNGLEDSFLWDRTTGTVTLLSHVDGAPATASSVESRSPVISRDGHWAAFVGSAHDLLPGHPGATGTQDLFLWETATGAFTLITHAPGSPGTPVGGTFSGLGVSDDGSWTAFGSTSSNLVSGQIDGAGSPDVFLWERATGTNTLVSHSTAGLARVGDAGSYLSPGALTGDGGHITFASDATDLVTGGTDTNGTQDVFLWDRDTGTISLLSRSTAGPTTAGNRLSYARGLAAAGNFAVFESYASDLAPGDTNGGLDVFLWDRAAGTSTALSFSPALPSITADPIHLAGLQALSTDGRFALFLSTATHLVAGQVDTNNGQDPFGGLDLFLNDRATGITTLVSHSTASPTTAANHETLQAALSGDGRWVAFVSSATDITDSGASSGDKVYLYDRINGTTILARSCFPYSFCDDPTLSADGRFLAYAKGFSVYLYDRLTDTATLVNHAAGSPADPSNGSVDRPLISSDGSFVVYWSDATNLIPGQVDTNNNLDLFLWDRASNTNQLVTHSGGSLNTAASNTTGFNFITPVQISADGRWVAYPSYSTGLINGGIDTNDQLDVFLFDRTTGVNTLVSRSASSPATAANDESLYLTDVSDDGRWVAFSSKATDLVSGGTDTNASFDAFVFDRLAGTVRLLSHQAGAPTVAGNWDSFAMAISADGNTVALQTTASDLVPGVTDDTGLADLVLIDRPTGIAELGSRSLSSASVAANGWTQPFAALSADGRVALFVSLASDLVADDNNLSQDLFAYVRSFFDYYTLTPCRLLDTRRPQDGPALASGATVSLAALGACGIPPTARALALNLTVTGGTGGGHLILFPGGTAAPETSAINFSAGATRANNAVVALGADGTLAVKPFVTGNGTVHVILDVSGYFQ
jgi:Tol biopolymer transport system component